MRVIYATVKSLWSKISDKGWYTWSQDHPDYSLTQYQAYLLYNFGEIQPQISFFCIENKALCAIFTLL